AQLVARSDAIAGILNSHLAGVVPVTESGDDAGEVSCVRPTVPFSHLHIGLVTIPDPVDRGITVVGSRTRGDIRTQIIFNLIVIIGFFPDPQMVELLGTIKSFLGLRRVQVKDDVMFRAVTVFDLANHYRWTAVLLLLLIEAFTGKGTKTGTDKGFTRRYGVRFQKCLVAAGGCNGFDDLLPAPLEKTERDRIRILSAHVPAQGFLILSEDKVVGLVYGQEVFLHLVYRDEQCPPDCFARFRCPPQVIEQAGSTVSGGFDHTQHIRSVEGRFDVSSPDLRIGPTAGLRSQDVLDCASDGYACGFLCIRHQQG